MTSDQPAVVLCLPALPVPVNRSNALRAGAKSKSGFRIGKTADYTSSIEAIGWHVQAQRKGICFRCPVEVWILAKRPRANYDIDGPIKPLLDALAKGGIYDNDKRVERLHVAFDPACDAGVVVTVRAI